MLALLLGFVLAIGRMSDHAWVRVPITAIVEVLRAVPVLIMMLLMYYGLPVLGVDVEVYWAVVIPLMLYNGSVLSEVIRAGVEALPSGQREAGYALGLRKSGVMQLILLPQAIRAMLPVIIAQLVVTLKDTALGFIITYPELLSFAKLIGSHASARNRAASRPGIGPRGHQCHSACSDNISSGASASHSRWSICNALNSRRSIRSAHIAANQRSGRHGT